MMLERIYEYCRAKAHVSESFPFDENTLVFKVAGKMFALLSLEANPLRTNLKCDPERAVELREMYPCVKPGFHMNKKHWNTVSPVPISDVPPKLFWELLHHSYSTVRNSLPVKVRNDLT
ncbi:MAG TPA: MmcQ-like protein [Bacteroidetes bacterium]|nr:MmcQ-like protein [Bacteroidota bacterium]